MVLTLQQREARATARMDKRRKVAERLCVRFGLPFKLHWADYRYWQCRRCGFDAENEMVWRWFCLLHPKVRFYLAANSPYRLIRAHGFTETWPTVSYGLRA